MPAADHEFGWQILPDLWAVSWLGMCAPQIDCHVFVLRGPDGLLLVDCGTPWGHERIVRNMAHWGLSIRDVRTILLTHGHVDHVSGGHLFKARGAEILGHREIKTLVECQWEATGALNAQGTSYRVDGAIADGDLIRRCGFDVRVIGTPGHTAGCISFLITVNGARCLFTGDLVMSNGKPGWSGDPGYSRAALVASLEHLLQVPFDHWCFGHGVILHDGGRHLRKALDMGAQGLWDEPAPRSA